MREIIAFTGSRADFYLQRPILKRINNDSRFNLRLIVSGGILEEKDQITLGDIIKEKFTIKKIYLPKSESINHVKFISYLSEKINEVICQFKPEMALVYADRYESFAFALSTFHNDVITIHIEAGDITEGGTYDDQIRHCITKLSHIFGCSTAKGVSVIKSLGEEAWRIKHIGLLSYEDMSLIPIEKSKSVAKSLNIRESSCLILCTLHPIPRNKKLTNHEISELMNGLKYLTNNIDIDLIITAPNHDEGSEIIREKIDQNLNYFKNTQFIESLGGYRYQALLGLVRCKQVILIGNSSSIIKEAPFFGINGVNIGIRQSGREKASTQLNIEAKAEIIVSTIKSIINLRADNSYNPYKKDNPSLNLLNHILNILENKTKDDILHKRWNHDEK